MTLLTQTWVAYGGGVASTDWLVILVIGAALVIWAASEIIKQKRGPGPTQSGQAPDSGNSGTSPTSSSTGPRAPRNGAASAVAKDIQELTAELEQLTHRLSSDIDQRATRLEALLRDADQRIAELRRLHDETPAPLANARPTSSNATNPTDANAHSAPISATPASEIGDDPLSRSVYALADAGHNSIEIARRLKEHVGKVELILALRRS